MGDYNSVRRNHEFMSISIYNFLDNILALVRPSETLESESQNCDQITTQVKPGGYAEDIFIFLSHRDKEEYSCSVCYSVVKDAHQCINGHKFCYSCIYVWSTCYRAGADCCPVCRCDGRYARNDQINEKIGRERVKCVSEGCNWRGYLRDYTEHQHRMYDFRELNTSIELPSIKPSELMNFKNNTNLQNNIGSNGLAKKKSETCDARGDFDPVVSTTNITDDESSTVNIPGAGGNAPISNMVPRRLLRTTENHLTNRATILRPTLNNVSRSTHTSTRCPTYRHSSTNSRLTRLPRNIVNGNLNNRDNNSVINAATSRPGALNESTQTIASDSSELITESNLLNIREFPRDLRDMTSPSGANGVHSPRNVQLPPINHSNVNNVNCDRAPMEYRRLAPTFASRRGNLVISQNEGREQLAMMLILLTSDLEERVSLSDQYQQQSTNSSPPMENQINTDTSVENTSSSNLNRSTGRLGRSRLQEFRNLNRRLSEVANSLDRLIVSTSRDDGRYRNQTLFSGTPEGSTSNVTSDADEDVNNNGSYR